jgi:hypothetical protein
VGRVGFGAVIAEVSGGQRLKEEVQLEGAAALELQHLYGAMDFLETTKNAIEKAIYFRIADLLNFDVESVFYDTTSLRFEVDEKERGFAERNEVHGSLATGRKAAAAARPRSVHSRAAWPVDHWARIASMHASR